MLEKRKAVLWEQVCHPTAPLRVYVINDRFIGYASLEAAGASQTVLASLL